MTKFAVLRPESNDSFDSRSTRFAQSWLLAPHASRSVRRRLAAILRMACRTLGLKRGRGLGMLGFGSRIAGAALASALIAGFASEALAGDGIFINDGTDGGCTVIRDGGTKPTIENIASDKCSKNDDVQYQTDRVLFYSYNNSTDKQSTSLSLGQFLWVNGGWIGLNQQTTKSMAIGNLGTAASGQDAIAIGNDAKASSNRSVALGAGSNANGGTLSNGAWFVGGSASAEMNIGSRRITGVAAGAMDSDAANVGQVKAAKNDTDNSIKTINTNINNIINNGTKGLVEQASPGQNLTVGKDIDGAAVDFAGKNKADGTKILRKLINVAPGAVNKDSNEVIVGKQLFETNTAVTNIDNRVTTNEGDIVSINTSIGDITTQVGGLLSDALLWDKDKLAFSAKHGTGGTNRIADVKAGENDTDAVNVKQLKDAQGTATTALKNAGDRAVKYVWDDKNKDGVLDAGEVDYTRANLEGPANAGTVLGNVAKGEVSAKSFDAVNGSQLFETNTAVTNIDNRVTTNEGDIVSINTSIGDITTQVGGLLSDALLWDKDKLAFSAKHGTGGTNRIADVKAGENDTDAVNVGQLKAAQGTATTALKNAGDRAVKYVWDDKNKDGVLDAGEVDYTRANLEGPANAGTVLGNVARGEVSAKSFDAVNGSQLFETNTAVTNIDNRVTTNEGDIVSINTSIGDITTQVGGLLSDALLWDKDKLAFSAKHGTGGTNRIADVKAGENDTDAVNVGQLKATQGTTDTKLNGIGDRAVKYDWNDTNGNGIVDFGEVDYKRVALGGSDGTTITNLASGAVTSNSMDAINGSQLFGVSSDIARFFGGGATFVDGVFKGPRYEITVINQDGTTTTQPHNNVGDALGGIDNSVRIVNAKVDNVTDQVNVLGNDALIWDPLKNAYTASHTDLTRREVSGTNKITDLKAADLNATSTDAVNGSQLNDTNNRVTKVEGDVIKIDNRVTKVEGDVNNIKTDIANITTNVGTLADRAVQYDGKIGDPKALITLQGDKSTDGGKTGGTQITNLKQGEVNAASTDAINGAQLNATNEQLNATNQKVDGLDDAAVKYKIEDGKKTNEVALVGGDPNAPVLISNVEAGKADNDAVNVKQLKYVDARIDEQAKVTNNQYIQYLDESKTYTDNSSRTTLNEAKNYTDQKFDELSMDIGSVRSEARQAAAIGLAASSLRYDNTPGKFSVAMGGGAWRGQAAAAFGAGYTSENGRIRANLSGVTSGGEFGVGAGISFTLN